MKVERQDPQPRAGTHSQAILEVFCTTFNAFLMLVVFDLESSPSREEARWGHCCFRKVDVRQEKDET